MHRIVDLDLKASNHINFLLSVKIFFPEPALGRILAQLRPVNQINKLGENLVSDRIKRWFHRQLTAGDPRLDTADRSLQQQNRLLRTMDNNRIMHDPCHTIANAFNTIRKISDSCSDLPKRCYLFEIFE